jgi:hypothetical protein
MTMDYENLEKRCSTTGHTFIVGHIFPGQSIQAGSRWISSSNNIVTVDKVVSYPASDHEDQNWYHVHYSWEENGERKTHEKDSFSFQCRYCLLVDSEDTGTRA